MDNLVRGLGAKKSYDEFMKALPSNKTENGRIFKNLENYMRDEYEKPRVVPKLRLVNLDLCFNLFSDKSR